MLYDVRSTNLTDDSPLVLLFLHGFGSHEQDLPQLAPLVAPGLPWASLRAPIKLGQGAAWFEIVTPGDPDAAPVEQATEAIWEWVDANLSPTARIVPVGFSQGGLMATQLLRTRPERVVAPVVLSGFVLGHPQAADDRLADLRRPAFHGRGDADQVITPAAVARTGDWLAANTDVTSRTYAGLPHAINGDEMADVHDFLAPLLEA